MKIRPLHDRMVVRRLEALHETLSGIVIPDTAAEKPDQGEVLAVGPGGRLEDGTICAPDVKVGDKVMLARHAGQAVMVHGEELLVLREDAVVGVMED